MPLILQDQQAAVSKALVLVLAQRQVRVLGGYSRQGRGGGRGRRCRQEW